MVNGLVPLSQVTATAAEDQELTPGFAAQLDGVEYVVTAVLERTAVLEVPGDRWADKRTARLETLLVDPSSITWQPKPLRHGPASWRGRRPPSANSEVQRTTTDERARADQARRAAVQPARPRPRPRPAVAPAQGKAAVGRQPVSDGPGGRPTQTVAAERARVTPPASSTATLPPAALPAVVTSASDRLPAPVRELVDRLAWALDRIYELEAERERSQAAQRRLIRRARAAMARRAS